MTKDRMTTTEIGRLERNHAILEDFFKHRSEFSSVTLLYAWLGNRHGCGGETVRRLLKTYGFDGAFGLRKPQPQNKAKK